MLKCAELYVIVTSDTNSVCYAEWKIGSDLKITCKSCNQDNDSMYCLSFPNTITQTDFKLKTNTELEIPRRRAVQPPLRTTYFKKCRFLVSFFHSM